MLTASGVALSLGYGVSASRQSQLSSTFRDNGLSTRKTTVDLPAVEEEDVRATCAPWCEQGSRLGR
jgi:hypothetical protein